MPATVYVGLFQASGTGAVATATFDNVSVTGASSAGAAALPSPWLSQDIGATFAPGSSTYAGGTFTLSGAGSGPYYAPDGFQFAYQTVTGDCTIVARVATQANSSQYAHAGVIIRDGLTANAGFADANFYPNGGGALFQYRADGGWASTKYGSGTAPYWVKLTRAGNTFTGFVSPDGTTWTTLGSTTITMPATVYVGLFQASGTGTLATSTFDNVSVTN
jgi:regulation of enolase protein 1 (concanavalin A-like superfamily)